MSGQIKRRHIRHAYTKRSQNEHAEPIKKRKKFQREWILLIGGLVLVIVLIAFFAYRAQHTATEVAVNKPDFSKLIEEAKPLIESKTTASLGETVGKIVATNGYETDKDALYIIVQYYITAGMPQDARSAITKLYKVVSGDQKFSTKLGATKSMVQLESEVSFLEKQANDFAEMSKRGLQSQ
jgi:hypothetical protein